MGPLGSFEDAELVDRRSPTGEIMDRHLGPSRSHAAYAGAHNEVIGAAPTAVEAAEKGVEQVVARAPTRWFTNERKAAPACIGEDLERLARPGLDARWPHEEQGSACMRRDRSVIAHEHREPWRRSRKPDVLG